MGKSGDTECVCSRPFDEENTDLCIKSKEQQHHCNIQEDASEKEKEKNGISRHWSSITKAYLDALDSHPLLTKCVTAGLIALLGDLLAQGLEYHMKDDGMMYHRFHIHRRRAFGIFVESTFVSGPIMHYSYDYLEEKVPIEEITDESSTGKEKDEQISSLRKWGAALFHVTVDLIILGPVFVLSMMVTSAFIEGTMATLWQELKTDFSPALWASTLSSLSFLPMQTLAFRLLSVKFRLLYMNLQDIIWNAVVSYMVHKSRKQDKV